MRRSLLSTAASLLLAGAWAAADALAMPEPISYTLRFPTPQTHYVEVEALVPTGGAATVELMMAVWTPGSYLVREYARNVEAVAAATLRGASRSASRRRARTAGGSHPRARRIAVRYRVYAREMSVRTNFVDRTSPSSTAPPPS